MNKRFFFLTLLTAVVIGVRAQSSDSTVARLPKTYQEDSVAEYVFSQMPDTAIVSLAGVLRNIFPVIDRTIPKAWQERIRADITMGFISEMDTEDPKPILDCYLAHSYTDSLQAKVRAVYQQTYEANHRLYPGNVAPDFSFTDTKGVKHRLSEYRGKLLLVDIWGTWCVPCLQELPHLKALQQKYGSRKDVQIMSVACDKQTARWKTFLAKHSMPWHQYLISRDGDKVLDTVYHVIGIPRFIVVGRDGKLISADSLRPSDKEFAAWFDSLVNR